MFVVLQVLHNADLCTKAVPVVFYGETDDFVYAQFDVVRLHVYLGFADVISRSSEAAISRGLWVNKMTEEIVVKYILYESISIRRRCPYPVSFQTQNLANQGQRGRDLPNPGPLRISFKGSA